MIIDAWAPVRTADVGGWTDTWFAGSGSVTNVAIEPGVRVQIVVEDASASPGQLMVVVGDAVPIVGEMPSLAQAMDPLLVAALSTTALPDGSLVRIQSAVPPGSGLGTSASVVVALLEALDAFAGLPSSPLERAHRAHRLESGLGLQTGVQDQAGAAHGGVHHYRIDYPTIVGGEALGTPELFAALDAQLHTVYLGRPHRSSDIHDRVIKTLETVDNRPFLAPIACAAIAARDALAAGDLAGFGGAMTANHAALEALGAGLVCDEAHAVIAVAKRHGALGWKTNGAGGEGGSIAVLGPSDAAANAALRTALAEVPQCSLLTTRVARTGSGARISP